ncbi:hypothetical protein MLD38_037994 [Melastoma candidum]|uniref:Uncharacterized protein n=1 Tax=Melastoma candidum TaxID=119954 RepID=A0ACB9KXM7_9MYRT|nr:hypothetical protein MLD38_037994 [Melastoma candidum]
MSTSRGRNFRRRADDDDDDEGGGDNNNGPQSATPTTSKPPSKPSAASSSSKPKKPDQQKQAPKPKLLSFADDEDSAADGPNIRPPRSKTPSSSSTRPAPKPSSATSSLSSTHKLTSSKDRHAAPSPSLPSNVLPQAGTYTKEALLELQKNTRTLARPARPSAPPDPKPETVVVLRGLLKPDDGVSAKSDGSPNGREDRVEKNEEEDEEAEDEWPDQAKIDAIRAKRERMRQSRAAAPDFISLDGGSALGSGTTEGLSDEEPEFRERIAMLGDSKKKGVFESFEDKVNIGKKGKGRGEYEYEVREEEPDEDEEEKIWEEEQFRKGLGKRVDDGTGRGIITGSLNLPQQQQNYYSGAKRGDGYIGTHIASMIPPPLPVSTAATTPSIGGMVSGVPILDGMSIKQQAEAARKALQENSRRLKESHGKTLSSLVKTDENLSASLLNITSLERALTAAGEEYIFMQKLRDYISVICKFLQDKAPYIEELEDQMQKLNEERASANLERRAADNEDELVEIEAAVNAASLVFRKGDSSASTIAAASSAAEVAVAALRKQSNLPVKLDEFGRDENLQKRMDMNRRAEARQRRKARFESRRLSSMDVDSPLQKIEGESSTDESDTETRAYKSNRDLLLQTADQIFDDSAEEFAQLSEVIKKFEKWKRDYARSYSDAYMSLSVPDIFSPYVRLELLRWDPLHEEADFFDMKWHTLLFNYGLPEDGSNVGYDDPDSDLVPGLVEKVALPLLHHEIAHCWDMLSIEETRNAVSATTLVINYVSASCEPLRELLVAVSTRLSDAVSSLTVPTWSPQVLKAVPNAARVAAYRFGMSVRLMRNICVWKEILAISVLERLALDELLCGKILPHVRCIMSDIHDAVTRCERIVASLSGVWTGPSASGDRSRKLQPLVEFVLSLGNALQKRHVSGVAEAETGNLARRLKKILVELNEYDYARELARAFHLKEAL